MIDHVEASAALAHWLARRMMLAGYQVWCRGLAPLAGSSVTETVRGLLSNRAFRYVCLLSPESLQDTEFTARRHMAQSIGKARGDEILIPAIASAIDTASLDADTRRLTPADFTSGWESGLRSITAALDAAHCPRHGAGAIDLAIRSYFPPDITLPEPETLASNLFTVTTVPTVIRRFYSQKSIDTVTETDQSLWAFRKVGPTHFLSFHRPPDTIDKAIGIADKGGAVLGTVSELDGISVSDLVVELLKKSLNAEARQRGLLFCDNRRVIYFPFTLLKKDHLLFKRFDGKATFFSVAGERTQGKGVHARKYRYHIAPVFACRTNSDGDYEIIVRIRVRSDRFGPRLFRNGSMPVLRGTFMKMTERSGLLYAAGFKTRLGTYDGWETPVPLRIDIQHGEAAIELVAADILGLTKLNYNACKLGDSRPVTVGFSDAVGEILISNPTVADRRPTFKFYI